MSVHPRRYAVIPTHNRPERLLTLVHSLAGQVDHAIIIDNASSPPVSRAELNFALSHTSTLVHIVRDDEQPPNLSRLWNVGLAKAAATEEAWTTIEAFPANPPQWDVAILNDDVELYPGWFDRLAGPMRARGAAAAFAAPGGGETLASATPEARPMRCLYGPAFIIRGELAAKPGDPLWGEERLRWWGGDNAMDVNAQRNGGVLRVSGDLVPNHHANQSTVGELAEQAGRDRETFNEIFGWYAW